MTSGESVEERRLCPDGACTGLLNGKGKCSVCGDAYAARPNPFVESVDEREYTPKPCGRKADWLVIGDVLDGGAGFVAVCRDCYKRGLQRARPATPDELVPAWIFKEELGKEPMCGDDDDSSALWEAIHSATEKVPEAPVNDRQFTRWVRFHDLRAHVHRVALERRLKRMESASSNIATAGSGILGILAALQVTKALGLEEGWPRWLAIGVTFLSVSALSNWYLLSRRIRKYVMIK
jgi:hypothetical protein